MDFLTIAYQPFHFKWLLKQSFLTFVKLARLKLHCYSFDVFVFVTASLPASLGILFIHLKDFSVGTVSSSSTRRHSSVVGTVLTHHK